MSVPGLFCGTGNPSKAARSGLKSPQDLSNQIWGTEKGSKPYLLRERITFWKIANRRLKKLSNRLQPRSKADERGHRPGGPHPGVKQTKSGAKQTLPLEGRL